jgi:hypothetical protein
MTVAPQSTLDAYEALRAAALRAEPGAGPDLGTLRREGLATWLKGLIRAPGCSASIPAATPHLPSLRDPAPAPSELTRLIASIVLAIAAEPAHV